MRMVRRCAVAAAFSLSATLEPAAVAVESPDTRGPARPAPPAAPEAQTAPRRVPDYDGRPPERDGPDDVALWVPRVALSPAYIASEFVLRRSMGELVVTAERGKWPVVLYDFFTFGEDHQAGLVPTALLDFGFRASIGIYGFWDGAFSPNNALRFRAATGGVDWLSFGLTDRISVSRRSVVAFQGEWTLRPDGLFAGIGPRSLDSGIGRYVYRRTQGMFLFDSLFGGQSSFHVEAGYRSMRFRDGACCDDPSITRRIAEGAYPPPPGLATGYDVAHEELEIALDTRRPRPETGSGLRLELYTGLFQRLDPASHGEWAGYGASVGGFVDLNGARRVLSLHLDTRIVTPLAGAEIPFTELIHLGGSEPMRGFDEGRLIGRSAAVATLQYEWPLWVAFNGAAQLAFGNVFGPNLEDFEPSLLRASGAIGLRTVGSDDHYLEILAGVGTETFEDGTSLTALRFVLGGNHGF